MQWQTQLLNNRESVRQKEKSSALGKLAFSITESEEKKSGLTQNKPLEATEGETHGGQRLDAA